LNPSLGVFFTRIILVILALINLQNGKKKNVAELKVAEMKKNLKISGYVLFIGFLMMLGGVCICSYAQF
jgi:hypothetical protein